MKMGSARSQDKIFADMHRELRVWNPQIPESPDRMDPILKILLQLFSHQLSGIERKVDMVWDAAANSLIRSLCPEGKRWPVPAFTVMRCRPTDPVVELDSNTRFFYKEERKGGQTFFFSPIRNEKLVSAEVKHVLFRRENTVLDFSPSSVESTTTPSRLQIAVSGGDRELIYIGIAYGGTSSDLDDVSLFLNGIPDALKQLRWSYWYPGTNSGRFNKDSGFCPGLSGGIEDMLSVNGRHVDWGGLRRSSDLFAPLEDNFVMLPKEFTSIWEKGPLEKEIYDLASANGIDLPTENDQLYWIRLDLPEGGDKSTLQSLFEIYFNCFVAVNKNELALFKHTGGNRLMEIELPENVANILEITNVVDSNGRTYVPRYEVSTNPSQRFYSLEERDSKPVLWFDFTSGIELPPDSITLNYSVTAGTSANGIEVGKINELYESHPGILSAENIIPANGAIPPKTQEQIVAEVSARLRSRDRALNFAEISNWAITFDPRVLKVECKNGIERADRGVRRCIVVNTTVKDEDFYSNDEISLLKIRLGNFLKSRSPVNTHFKVEVSKA